jgi:predicted RNase H-like nuclease (RuvC/YqgF family)
MGEPARSWDGAIVRAWLESRVVAARADQVAAERYGRERQDDCDKANAEEMVCALLKGKAAIDIQKDFAAELKSLLDRDDYVGRGVYDDTRYERHVRSYIRKLIKMTKDNAGFENTRRYQ